MKLITGWLLAGGISDLLVADHSPPIRVCFSLVLKWKFA